MDSYEYVISHEWVKEFYKLYNPENKEKALVLLNEKYPETICRYIKPRFVDGFIDESKLTFIHPCQFEENDSRWFQFEQNDEYSDENNRIIGVWEKQRKERGDPFFDLHKICSLTTNPLDRYMWENYAENYSGICIEFCKDRPDLESYEILTRTSKVGVKLLPILYTKNQPDLSELLLSWENHRPEDFFFYYFDHLLLNLKKYDFRSEKEWRAFCYMDLTTKEPEKLSTATIPSNIYFGENISRDLRERILDYASDQTDVYEVTETTGRLEKKLIHSINSPS